MDWILVDLIALAVVALGVGAVLHELRASRVLSAGQRRLLELAEVLEAAGRQPIGISRSAFDQGEYYHEDGSPSDALKHWEVHTGRPQGLATAEAEFGLSYDEMIELFDVGGCGGAKTPRQAARYLRAFVRRRSPAQDLIART